MLGYIFYSPLFLQETQKGEKAFTHSYPEVESPGSKIPQLVTRSSRERTGLNSSKVNNIGLMISLYFIFI